MKFISKTKTALATANKSMRKTWTTTKILGKKHAPLALTVLAGVGFIATAVEAYKSAKKADETFKGFEERKEAGEEIPKQEIVIAVAKDFAKPVILGTLSTSALVLSYAIQNNRLKAVTAALAIATEEHERYRRRAKEVLDEVTFKKIDAPMETKMIETEEGEKEVNVVKEGDFYGKWFMYSNEYTDDNDYNTQWIKSVYDKASDIIMRKGVLMYNELMDMLGFSNISNSLPFGWTDNDGFYIEFDEHVTWNEHTQMEEPQLYVRWKTPRNLYSTTSFKTLLGGE